MTDIPAVPTLRSFAFGPFTLIPERQLLLNGETPVRIGGRALDILTALVERPGELISKRELLSRAWPNTIVEESNLKVNMAGLRRVLGEEMGASQYIVTVIGRGYRFVGTVVPSSATGPAVDIDDGRRNHNLPTGTTRVVGRDDVIEAIGCDVDGARLVSIVGAGGIGKTTVALAVAERALTSARDGVWLVDLASLTDESLVPNAIAAAIGFAANSTNMLAGLCCYFRNRELLLLLDNCEHLIEAVALSVSRILAEAPDVKILTTSREPLRLKGERVRRLPPLGTPPVSASLGAAEALAFPAVQLFVDRAMDRLESFVLTDADAPLVAEICRRLDGLALAIELAATQLDAFGVGQLFQLIDDHLRLLHGHRAGPARQLSLTATIDWSYNLLSDSEKIVMRRLSVFSGGFNLASARAVIADEGIDPVQVVEDIASMVAKSLLSAEPRDVEVEYRQLHTTRVYARSKLMEHGELADASRRHAEYFLDRARAANAAAGQLTKREWVARHGGMIDDVRAAMSWSFGSIADAGIGVGLTVAAIPFWEHLALVEECRIAVERALDDRYRAYLGDRDELLLCMAHGATLFHTRGPLPEVRATWVRALELARISGDTDRQLSCLKSLSDHDIWTGELHSALTVTDEIRSIAVARNDHAAATGIDMQAGVALRYLGRLEEARRCLERSLAGQEAAIAPQDSARFEFDARLIAQGSLALVRWMQGYPDQALDMAEQQRADALHSKHAISICSAFLNTTCPMALDAGAFDLAAQSLDFISHYADEHGLTVWSAMAVCLRGRLDLELGNMSGIDTLPAALATLHDVGFRVRYPAYLAIYADGLMRRGDIDHAHATIDEAVAQSKTRDQVWCLPELLRVKGDIARAEGGRKSTPIASAKYLEAIQIARDQGALTLELRTLLSLVDLHLGTRQEGEARDRLAAAYGRFQEGFETQDLRRARMLLAADPPRQSRKSSSYVKQMDAPIPMARLN